MLRWLPTTHKSGNIFFISCPRQVFVTLKMSNNLVCCVYYRPPTASCRVSSPRSWAMLRQPLPFHQCHATHSSTFSKKPSTRQCVRECQIALNPVSHLVGRYPRAILALTKMFRCLVITFSELVEIGSSPLVFVTMLS